ncbi:MAG: 30S ribosomal protein S16 [Terriglobia bacterium]
MLRIRLARAGAKKKVSYRVVVIDRESPRNGRFVEILGSYNPRRDPPELVLNRERAAYWVKVGAQPSETVRSLLKKAPAPALDAPAGLAK